MKHVEHAHDEVFPLMRDTMNVVMTIQVVVEIERCGVNG